jgi:hypothetical protein
MFAILLVPVLLLVLPVASLPLRLFRPGMLLSLIVHLRFTILIESRFSFLSGLLVRGWPLSSRRRFLLIGLMMMFAFKLVGFGAVKGFEFLGGWRWFWRSSVCPSAFLLFVYSLSDFNGM